jgi:hypothetical protein
MCTRTCSLDNISERGNNVKVNSVLTSLLQDKQPQSSGQATNNMRQSVVEPNFIKKEMSYEDMDDWCNFSPIVQEKKVDVVELENRLFRDLSRVENKKQKSLLEKRNFIDFCDRYDKIERRWNLHEDLDEEDFDDFYNAPCSYCHKNLDDCRCTDYWLNDIERLRGGFSDHQESTIPEVDEFPDFDLSGVFHVEDAYLGELDRQLSTPMSNDDYLFDECLCNCLEEKCNFCQIIQQVDDNFKQVHADFVEKELKGEFVNCKCYDCISKVEWNLELPRQFKPQSKDTFEQRTAINVCSCTKSSMSLYADAINYLASINTVTTKQANAFWKRYKVVDDFKCKCFYNRFVVQFIRDSFSATPQMRMPGASYINNTIDSKVDEITVKLGTVIRNNLQIGLKQETKDFLNEKIQDLDNISKTSQVQLALPDASGLGRVLQSLFSSEYIGYSSVVIFAILFLSKKYHPSLGQVCALFAGMAICYASTPAMLRIVTEWLNPQPQAASEWVTIIAEIFSLSFFAGTARWDWDIKVITDQLVEIENKKPKIDSLIDRVQGICFKLIDMIAQQFGMEFNHDFDPFAQRISRVRKRLSALAINPMSRGGADAAFVRDVNSVFEEVMSIYEDVTENKKNEKYLTQVTSMLQILNPLLELLGTYSTLDAKFAPFVHCMVGNTGMGKSAYEKELITEMFYEFATDDEKAMAADKFANICYPISSSQKYFETYRRHFFMLMNDMFQKREKLGQDFSPTEFVIQLVGNDRKFLPCAAVKKKDVVEAANLALHINQNLYCITDVNCPTIECCDPYNRRMNDENSALPVIMAVNMQYSKLYFDPAKVYPVAPMGYPADFFKRTVDKNLVPRDETGKLDYSDVHIFFDWNFKTGQLLRGYKTYSKAQHKAEYKKRFAQHYKDQMDFLNKPVEPQVANRIAEIAELPIHVNVQSKEEEDFDTADEGSYEDWKAEKLRKLMGAREGSFSYLSDEYKSDEESEKDFQRIVNNNPNLFKQGYEEDSDGDVIFDDKGEPIPLFDPELTGLAVEIMQPYYDKEFIEPSSSIRVALTKFIDLAPDDVTFTQFKTQERNSDLDYQGLTKKEARHASMFSIPEMKKLIQLKFTNPMIYALQKIRQKKDEFMYACGIVCFGLSSVVLSQWDRFKANPVLWFKGHPLVSVVAGGITALALYGTVKMVINFFSKFCLTTEQKEYVSLKKEIEKDDKIMEKHFDKKINEFYMNHLKEPGLTHNLDCCSEKGILKAYFESDEFISREDPFISNKHWNKITELDPTIFESNNLSRLVLLQQRKIKEEEEKTRYVVASLENFYHFHVRWTYTDAFGEIKVLDEDMQNCFAIIGHLYDINYHAYRTIQLKRKRGNVLSCHVGLIPFNCGNLKPDKWFEWDNIVWHVDDEFYKSRDEAFFCLPSTTKNHGDIRERMPCKSAAYQRIIENTVGLPIIYYRRSAGIDQRSFANLTKFNTSYHLPTSIALTKEEDVLKEQLVQLRGSTLDVETEGGDCSMPMFNWGTATQAYSKEDSVLQHPFVIARHCAISVDEAKKPIAGLFFREDYFGLEKWRQGPKLKVKPAVEAIDDKIKNIVNLGNKVLNQNKTFESIFTDFDKPKNSLDHHIILGRIAPQTINKRNRIKRSILFKQIKHRYGITVMPVSLSEHGALTRAISTYGSNIEDFINDKEADQIVDHCVSLRMTRSSKITPDMQLALDAEVAIEGGNGIGGLNRKSAIGPCLEEACRILEVDPQDLKKCLGTEGPYTFDNPLAVWFLETVKFGMEQARNGEVPFGLTKNHLKVECKSKPRVFQGCDKDYISINQAFFGNYVKWLIDNRIRNNSLCGVNPPKEWKTVHMHLNEMKDPKTGKTKTVPGDFEKFDKKQFNVLKKLTKASYKAFYGHSHPRDNLARDATFENNLRPTCICCDEEETYIYQWLHGNISGGYLTTPINNDANEMIFYICSVWILRQQDRFKDWELDRLLNYITYNSRLVFMGDDHIIAVSPDFSQYFTFYTYKNAIETIFHMGYTDDFKGIRDDVVPDHTDLDDATILARSFNIVDGEMVGLLRDKSLYEPLAWDKGTECSNETTLDKVQRCLVELSAAGREKFGIEAPIIANMYYKASGGVWPKYTNFEVAFSAYRDLKFPEYNFYTSVETQSKFFNWKGFDTSTPYPTIYSNQVKGSKESIEKQLIKIKASSVPKRGDALCFFEWKEKTMKSNKHLIFDSSSYVKVKTQSCDSKDIMAAGVRTNEESKENSVICDNAQTTCFVEDSTKVESSLCHTTPGDYIQKQNISISQFLGKPQLLTTLNWGAGSATNTNLYYIDIESLLYSVDAWNRKLYGYNLVRGTFVIRLMLNADPFQWGLGVLRYIANYVDRITLDSTFEGRHNTELIMKFQHPHILIDAQDAVAEMRIPYVAPTTHFSMKDGTIGWGRVFFDVVVPLTSGAAAPNPNAQVSIFGYWEDFEVAAPMVPQSRFNDWVNCEVITQSRSYFDQGNSNFGSDEGVSMSKFSSSKSRERSEETNKISDGLSIGAKVVRALGEIPILKAVAEPASWLLMGASRVAAFFGWSQPRVSTAPMVMLAQGFRYIGNSDGHNIATGTALVHDNALSIVNNYSITEEDQMSLRYLLNVPTYMGYTLWTTAQAPDTLLFSQIIKPSLFRQDLTTTHNLHSTTSSVGAPLWYLSNFFAYYSGGMTAHIDIIKNDKYSGKLVFTWTPIKTVTNVPDNTTSLYSYRHIVDIRDQGTIDLELPYLLNQPYCEQTEAIGLLTCRVLNTLRCPETCPQSVAIVKQYRAAADFEYQVPCCSITAGSAIFSPQSRTNDQMVQDGIGGSTVPNFHLDKASKSIGESFTSIKQLLNRVTQSQPRVTNITSWGSLQIYPWFVNGLTMDQTTGALLGEEYAADAFSFFAPMYLYFRGRADLFVGNQVGQNYQSSITPMFSRISSMVSWMVRSTLVATANPLGTSKLVVDYANPDKQPFQSFVPNNNGTSCTHVYHQIPYQARFPISFVDIWAGNTPSYFANDRTMSCNVASINISTPSASQPVICRSFGDDFQLCYFLSCPPLFTSYT